MRRVAGVVVLSALLVPLAAGPAADPTPDEILAAFEKKIKDISESAGAGRRVHRGGPHGQVSQTVPAGAPRPTRRLRPAGVSSAPTRPAPHLPTSSTSPTATTSPTTPRPTASSSTLAGSHSRRTVRSTAQRNSTSTSPAAKALTPTSTPLTPAPIWPSAPPHPPRQLRGPVPVGKARPNDVLNGPASRFPGKLIAALALTYSTAASCGSPRPGRVALRACSGG